MNFTKMHGLGNQYIFVNQFAEALAEEDLSSLAVEVSDIYTGVGSDGLILIDASAEADLKMRIFNKDGSEAKNCGNGLRCVAKYAYERKLVSSRQMSIETLGGIVRAEVHLHPGTGNVQQITVDMGSPRLAPADIPVLETEKKPVVQEPLIVGEETYLMTAVSMGNPHAVFFVEDIQQAPLTTAGPLIEKHARFPESVNVEFVEMVSPTEMHFRVWERGSGITQACGTGACAAVTAAVLNGFSEKGKEVLVHLAGGDLRITWDDDDHVWMKGPAETICDGIYFPKGKRE
ncbi:diaminopimelate epimerase [Evansella caseinilytica]|uniref:Diaminopimelate epimerase n=1 Tax=Evansella caseinilytica TaxID=1503961 RepID=A0A1H3UEF2_9BACI|nr:diaminopimelate epimerase [Evansella caseinilytica]SDZ60421.1 diaminopimelate epimerase [Evansella caseinilytica]